MNIACPECATVYRIDPDRVPESGAVTECRECETRFRVTRDLGPTPPGETVAAPRVEAAESHESVPEREEVRPALDRPEPEVTGEGGAPAFGPQDPDTRAKRLARALVSDIKVYHPDRWEESAEKGTLRTDFRDEILKSWEEYVEQVGEGMAKRTPYFRDALNDILAQGDRVF